jgi:ribonuclease D
VGEDLEVLRDFLNIVPAPVFDTQVAAALAGYGPSLSLANLVQQRLQITLDKSETTSDWLQRPLSASQIAYAAEDVRVLLPLHTQLCREQTPERLSWVRADCGQAVEKARANPIPTQPHHKLASAQKLPLIQQERLWRLLCWREQHARQKNLPRNWLLETSEAFEIAAINASGRSAWTNALQQQLPKRRRYAEELFDVLSADSVSGETSAQFEAFPVQTSEHKDAFQKLRTQAQAAAAKAGLPPEVFASKRMLEALLENPNSSDPALQWRAQLIANH